MQILTAELGIVPGDKHIAISIAKLAEGGSTAKSLPELNSGHSLQRVAEDVQCLQQCLVTSRYLCVLPQTTKKPQTSAHCSQMLLSHCLLFKAL